MENWNRKTLTVDASENIIQDLFEKWENGKWVNVSLVNDSFNLDGKLIFHQRQTWDSISWRGIERDIYSYDQSGERSTLEHFKWQAGQWMPEFLWAYPNNSSNGVDTVLRYSWDGVSWIDDLRNITSRDSINRINIETREIYSQSSGNWDNHIRFTSHLDLEGRIASWIREDGSDTVWNKTWNQHYTYNTKGAIVEHRKQEWDSTTWVNSWRYFYSYDHKDHADTSYWEVWENGRWANSLLFNLDLDDQGNQLMNEYFLWSDSIWKKGIRTEYKFTSDDKKLYKKSFEGSTNGLSWKRLDSIYYFYSSPNASFESRSHISAYDVYPNPTRDILNVQSITPGKSIESIVLLSYLGHQIRQFNFQSAEFCTIKCDPLSPGIYFLAVQDVKMEMEIIRFVVN